jgi:hypothetical protein
LSGAPKAGKTKNHTVAGKISTALTFDGIDDFVEIPAIDVNTNTISFSAWAKRADPMNAFAGIVFASDPNYVTAGFGLGAERDEWTQNYELMYMWSGTDWEWQPKTFMPGDDLWSFIALTIAPDAGTMYLYDGFELVALRNIHAYTKKYFGGAPLRIADQLQYPDRLWNGDIDDVRIYDYTLSPENVLYLALQGAGSQYVAMPWWRPDADGDGKINGRDFAALGENWLNQAFWP